MTTACAFCGRPMGDGWNHDPCDRWSDPTTFRAIQARQATARVTLAHAAACYAETDVLLADALANGYQADVIDVLDAARDAAEGDLRDAATEHWHAVAAYRQAVAA